MTFRAFAQRADFGAAPIASQSAAEDGYVISPVRASARSDLHPLILELMRELPPAGEPFPGKKQEDWLEIAQATFRLIHPDAEAHVTVEETVEVEGAAFDERSGNEM